MRETPVEHRLRNVLLGASGFLWIGTLVELGLTGHTGGPVQLLPFGLCGLGLAAVLAAFYRPGRGVLLALRVVMGGIALCGLFGLYEHFAHNLAFELEIRPSAAPADVLGEALQGASPLLAPGTLVLAAFLAAAATYEHPGLSS